jgi:serine protease DegS
MYTRTLLMLILRAFATILAMVVLLYLFWTNLIEWHRPVVEIQESVAPINPSAIESPGQEWAGPVSYARAVQEAAPSVVNISSTKVVTRRSHQWLDEPIFRYFFGDDTGEPRKRLETSLGSGVIVSPQGYILTNNHVIEGADEIEISLQDGQIKRAQIVGSDPETDLAVLKIPADGLSAISLGRSDSLKVGDVVLAIGNPFALGQTVTSGIVSATGRNQLGLNTFEDFIQTDAAINRGNSGGALIDSRGRLVGINTAIFSPSGGFQGIGFAIPVDLAKGVVKQIIETGRVVRGWLGVEIQDLTPALAESFNLKDTRGILVAGVLRKGPADQAGLLPGDVITHVEGKPLDNSRDILNRIAQTLPGSRLSLRIVRQGKQRDVVAQIARRPQHVSR